MIRILKGMTLDRERHIGVRRVFYEQCPCRKCQANLVTVPSGFEKGEPGMRLRKRVFRR